ncbi:MAG: PrsW family glutamic-type intramembrane protease [Chloroflexota bacterium]
MATWLIAALAAVLVSLVYVILLRFIDRYEPDPWRWVLTAFALGAVVVPIVVMGGRLLIGQEFSLPLPYASDRPYPGVRIAEQVTVGILLLAFVYAIRAEFDDALDGVVYGAAIGAGLGAAQTVLYAAAAYGSSQGLPQGASFATILVSGLNQAAYGGIFGAFLGYAYWYVRGPRSVIVVILGLATAAMASAFHDTLPYMLARLFDRPDVTAGLLTRGAIFAINLVGPLALLIAVLHFIRHESQILRTFLTPEVASGTIGRDDLDEVQSFRSRLDREFGFVRAGRFGDLRLLRRFYRAEGQLAFHLWHMRLGRAGDAATAREEELRARTRDLRVGVEAARAVDRDEGPAR